MAKSIGIDLGTTNSVVAFKDATVRVIATGPNNEELCRSCVAVDKSGSMVVGNLAFNNWKRYAPNIVISAKRLMGTAISDSQVQKMKADKEMYPYGISKFSGGTDDSVAIILNGKEYTPEQISAEILRQLKYDAEVKLGDEVTHAVITVPAYFNEKQKSATRKAAELAGLKVQRLLAEPTAAAISYGADKMSADEDKIFLVYDFGGGTFDLSILVASRGTFIESGTGGDRWLGGDDIDRLLSEYVLNEAGKANNVDIHELINQLSDRKKYNFQGEFKSQVESAKKVLSQTEKVTISAYDFLETDDGDPIDIEVTVTRSQFNDLIRPLIQRTINLIDELLEKTAYPIETIDNILLVGGSSCIPLVREMLIAKYGKNKILSSEKPMLAIAEGAAILSHSIGTSMECPHCGNSISLGHDCCPICGKSLCIDNPTTDQQAKTGIYVTTKHKYFIETRDDADGIQYSMIIDANEVLPNEVHQKFYTIVENQKIVAVRLYNDAENDTKERIGIGYFAITENLPIHSELQFSFYISEDETLSLKVRIGATGRTQTIVYGRGSLDSHCFDTIQSSFNKVMGDPNISDEKKSVFIEKLQKTIDAIQSSGLTPESIEWQKYESSIQSAITIATTKENDIDVEVIISFILIRNFSNFLSENDKQTLRSEIERYKQETNPLIKNEIIDKISTINEKYGLLVHGFLLNVSAQDKDDPVNANKALVAYNQFMGALNDRDFQRAAEILSANEHLIKNNALPSGSFTDGLGFE